jgi:hypothetical protein
MRPRLFSTATVSIVFALAAFVASCTDDGGSDATTPGPSPPTSSTAAPVTPAETTSATPSPTEPPAPDTAPATRGAVATDCINGWVTPPKDSPKSSSPIGVIRRVTAVKGPLEVVDLRYFEGPESPPSEQGYLLLVQRWYVKLYAKRDYAFAGRFLIEARRFGQGLAAVAPYDSRGWASPDWIGFQRSADTTERSYEGLPGTWRGTPYDFVEGGEGVEIPGLPDDVVGCLDGT